MNRKKRLERFYLEAFLRYTGLHEYEIVAEPEPPDFVVDTGREHIGVEVTNLYKNEGPRGSSLKKAEQHNSRFLRALAQAYNAHDGPPLSVQLLTRHSLDLAIVADLATRLHADCPAEVRGRTTFEMNVGGGRRAKFFLMRLSDDEDRYRHWYCASDSVGWVRSVSREALEARILDKAAKLGEYRKAADRIMLLIVADRTKNSGMFRFEPTGTPFEAHGFLEVHLFLYPEASYRVA